MEELTFQTGQAVRPAVVAKPRAAAVVQKAKRQEPVAGTTA